MAFMYRFDSRETQRELGRLSNGPDRQCVHELNFILESLFAQTQADVHVETGALMASGRVNENRSFAHHWRGDIIYGGGGVDYAGYEKARGENNTGNHDFMRATEHADERYREPIVDFFRRSSR